MARLVRLEATVPMKIDPATLPLDEHGKPKLLSLCTCGLSLKFPLCDGAHKHARVTEQPGMLYVYDKDGKTVLHAQPDTGEVPITR